ncbi:MAG: 4-hydroxybenzoate octaprenyltransferase [bacterium]|nr:4-hydroxybenzoate octaprenyltransferase [bacterium]
MELGRFGKLVMIEQTLFALPFAYIGILFAGGGSPMEWLWATAALFGARTAGMSFNRVLDAEIDAENPRTENRLIPRGEVSKASVWGLAFISSLLLIGAAYMLNMLCFYLSFAAIVLLFTYSFFKRFSSGSHFYLGFVEAAAPIGGYLAVKPEFTYFTFIPGIAIMFWIAGLDILYSVQDMSHDKKEGLFSIPSRFGKSKALLISSTSYLLSLAALFAAGYIVKMGAVYWVSIGAVAVIFMRQQSLAYGGKEEYETRVIEVFRLNRFVSPVICIGALIDYLTRTL